MTKDTERIMAILWAEWRGYALEYGQREQLQWWGTQNVLKWEGLDVVMETYTTQPQKVVKLNIELCLT